MNKSVAYTCGSMCLYVYHWSSTCAESTEKKHSRSPGLVHPHKFRRAGWRWLWEEQVRPICSRSAFCSLVTALWIWTCRPYVDGLKIRQHPNCQRGTADVLAFTVSEVFEHLRVYLCPSTVAGIHTKLVLVGNGSRELALTLQKLHRVPCVIVASSFLALSQRFQQSP